MYGLTQTKSFLVSASSNKFANGVQYFLKKAEELNFEEMEKEVFLIVRESKSTEKVVLGIENTSNITVSSKVTEQILSNDPKLFNLQLWVKSGNSSQIE